MTVRKTITKKFLFNNTPPNPQNDYNIVIYEQINWCLFMEWIQISLRGDKAVTSTEKVQSLWCYPFSKRAAESNLWYLSFEQ